MVRSITFVFMIITFFVTNILLERKFKKSPPKFKLGKVIAYSFLYTFVLLTIAVLFEFGFYLLIYGRIIEGCFIIVYFRHRPKTVLEH